MEQSLKREEKKTLKNEYLEKRNWGKVAFDKRLPRN